MNCREIKKLLVPFLESQLPESERVIIEAHLYECEDCQKEKVLLEKTWSMLDGFQAPEVSSNFTWNLMARIHEQEEEKPKFSFVFPEINIQFGFRVLAPVMVSACVLIAVYLFVQNHLNQEQQVAKVVSPEQKTIIQAQKEVPVESEVNAAKVTPVERKEDSRIAATQLAENEKVKIAAGDEEIIRNLEVYKNIELYQNYALVNDLDVVENLDEGTS